MGDHGMGMAMALFMEAFVSIHMSVFVLLPLSKMISRENSKKIFWILFWIRIVILLCFDFFITTGIAVVDFLAVFVGAFLVTPISIKKGIRITKGSERSGAPSDAQTSAPSDTPSEKTILVSAEQGSEKKAVHAADFDPLFAMPEEKCVEAFLKREMQRAGIAEEQGLIPEDMLRRKNILNSPRSFRPLPEDIFFARTGIQLYRSHSGSFLSTVVLFFHQQVKLIHPPKNISVFFPVVFQRFQQPHHGNPTFMFNCVTHNISIPVRYLKNKSSRYFGNVHISLSTINSNLSI